MGCAFSDTMSMNSHGQSAQCSIKIVQSHFKLWHQVASTSISTCFLIPLPPLCGHPLPPSSALVNAHMWAKPGQACRAQQSYAPFYHHLTAVVSMCFSNYINLNDKLESWGSVRRVGKRGKQGQEDDNDAACNPHAALSSSFPPIYLTMWSATHTPHCLFLFLPILSDDMAIYIPLEFIRSVLCYNL